MASTAIEKGTNVRITPLVAAVLGRAADLAPAFAARVAIDRFTRTIRPPDARIDEAGRLGVVMPDGRIVPTFTLGSGRTVVLVHGWSGRGAQLLPLAKALAAAGHRAVWYDAPGHGDADGSTSNLGEMVRALVAVEAAVGEAPVAVVAHSFGGAAAAIAAQRGLLRAERVVTIGSPADGGVWLPAFVRAIGGSDALLQAAIAELCGRAGLDWSEVKVAARPIGRPALVLHDEGDREVPVASADALAAGWGAAQVRTTGLGHRRILADGGVAEAIVAWLADREARRAA